MLKKRTLRFKILFGFIAVIVTLTAALIFQNYYAMRVVRDEVSHSTSNLLSLHVSQIDSKLDDVSKYLLRIGSNDYYYSDLIGLSLYPKDSSDYFFAKQRLFNSFQAQLTSYPVVDTFFAYSAKYDDLIATQTTYLSSERIRPMIMDVMHTQNLQRSTQWQILRQEDHSYLYWIEQIRPDVYFGSIVDSSDLLSPLRYVDLGKKGEALLLSTDGKALTDTAFNAASLKDIEAILKADSKGYATYKDRTNNLDYLLVGLQFQNAPISLAIFIPESGLLQKLPILQRGIYAIPIIILALLYLFSFMLKRVLQRPMNTLIRGMRRMSEGDFQIRLNEGSTVEFTYLSDTFNKMVTQIRDLKIHVYEEKLKAQESEFKQLQAQINPHFYLNTLNIIYSLSQLRRNELVEKMTMHLADYFRFIMRADKKFIQLHEEMDHIRNYLEIQRLRFPNKLEYEIRLPDEYRERSVFPLMIQPFVENAIIHGMQRGQAAFHIEISADAVPNSPGLYEIVISDNGKGFPPDTLQRLQNGQPADPSASKSVGIKNILNRLRLQFDNEVTVLFRNKEDKTDIRGAEIRIRIPFKWEEEGVEGLV